MDRTRNKHRLFLMRLQIQKQQAPFFQKGPAAFLKSNEIIRRS